MKKAAAVILILALIFTLAGCGKKEEEPAPAPAEQKIEIELPADIAGDVKEENLSGFIEYYGLESAVINGDGSVTAVMTYERWITTVALIRTQIDEQLSGIVRSQRYPEISGAASGDEYTSFTIRTGNNPLSDEEKELCYLLGGYAYYHAVFYKATPLRFRIVFLESGSGEEILVYDQDDWLAEKE